MGSDQGNYFGFGFRFDRASGRAGQSERVLGRPQLPMALYSAIGNACSSIIRFLNRILFCFSFFGFFVFFSEVKKSKEKSRKVQKSNEK